ncbi:MAG: ribonuclease P protein component [Alphaproteobacteria bacterium]|nr:ribonuclease P protein component [Alphaproteobacteria bacterium]
MKRPVIRKYSDFLTAKNDFSLQGDLFIIKTKNVKQDGIARYGIIAGKKFFRLAVERNRAKRLLRDWVAWNEDLMLDNLDYIFVARPDILQAKREDGRNQMKDMLNTISSKIQ